MNYLSAEHLSKRYGEHILFSDLSFGLSRGQKTALIANNGTGKTSLLQILCGLEEPDEGKVAVRTGLRVGYLPQDPVFKGFEMVSDYVLDQRDPTQQAVKDYEHALATNDMDALTLAAASMDSLNAWDYEQRMKTTLGRFGIEDLEQTISTLSGGQRKRLALAKMLLTEPDIYVMDEPTNHLDLDMIEWLEGYLSRQNVTLLLVTHDRYFLDRICTQIVELEQAVLYKYEGNYEYFLEKKNERDFNESRETEKAKNLYRTELEWIRKMPKARGTKSKSRVDAFDDLKAVALRKTKYQELSFNIKMNRIGGKILEMKNVKKAYGDNVLLKGFDYTFKKGDRIGIVGKNGVGKSTLLNMITGHEQPDYGKMNLGDTIVFGNYTQEGIPIKEDQKVIDVIRSIADFIPTEDGGHISASQMLTAFHFPPKRQNDFVAKLSGGERRRLYLLTVLMKNPNFLILDEPTNDLDLLTLNALEEFLLEYTGVLIIVSHDRYFLDKLANQLFIFEGNGEIRVFNGTYLQYRDEQATLSKSNEPAKTVVAKTAIPVESKIKKLSFKEKFELDTLEKEMKQLEKNKLDLEQKLSSGGHHEDITKWAAQLEETKAKMDDKELRWLELSEVEA
ncbi:MAG: ABC transporter ATP-binding protein [Flavobacteriaceae bacterium]|nr:ABC transporter ATP-binding protein [Flavobacteriaceae bacterium]